MCVYIYIYIYTYIYIYRTDTSIQQIVVIVPGMLNFGTGRNRTQNRTEPNQLIFEKSGTETNRTGSFLQIAVIQNFGIRPTANILPADVISLDYEGHPAEHFPRTTSAWKVVALKRS